MFKFKSGAPSGLHSSDFNKYSPTSVPPGILFRESTTLSFILNFLSIIFKAIPETNTTTAVDRCTPRLWIFQVMWAFAGAARDAVAPTVKSHAPKCKKLPRPAP